MSATERVDTLVTSFSLVAAYTSIIRAAQTIVSYYYNYFSVGGSIDNR